MRSMRKTTRSIGEITRSIGKITMSIKEINMSIGEITRSFRESDEECGVVETKSARMGVRRREESSQACHGVRSPRSIAQTFNHMFNQPLTNQSINRGRRCNVQSSEEAS